MKKNSKKGFSLIELILVIAIIAFLLALGIVAYKDVYIKAKYTRMVAQLATMDRTMMMAAGWTFDECSGNKVVDISGNGNDGTLYGDTYFTTEHSPRFSWPRCWPLRFEF
jgi:prepilin-type N-terminal cleavage/methylation domain-containing protein